MADRVAIMRKGVLQDVGTPTQVYGRPAHPLRRRVPRQPADEPARGVGLRPPRPLRRAAPRRPGALPALARHPGPGGGALPRRADRGRGAGRGAHPGRARTPRATCCRAGSATSSTTATSRWPSSTSAPPRCWSTRWAAAPPRTRTASSGALRRFGAASCTGSPGGPASRRRPREPTRRQPDQRAERPRPAPPAPGRAGGPAGAVPGDLGRGTRWRSRSGWTPCTSSTNAATASTSAGADPPRPAPSRVGSQCHRSCGIGTPLMPQLQ